MAHLKPLSSTKFRENKQFCMVINVKSEFLFIMMEKFRQKNKKAPAEAKAFFKIFYR